MEDIEGSAFGLPGNILLKADRLEPSNTLLDIGEGFDNLCEFPCTVVFWRRSSETIALHRNPLFS